MEVRQTVYAERHRNNLIPFLVYEKYWMKRADILCTMPEHVWIDRNTKESSPYRILLLYIML